METTRGPDYLEIVGSLLATDLPFHLLAGERSQPGWSVPGWVRRQAASDGVIVGTGHLMMLEDPIAFGNAILDRSV